jgi:adenosylcobinamide amidohydrolase
MFKPQSECRWCWAVAEEPVVVASVRAFGGALAWPGWGGSACFGVVSWPGLPDDFQQGGRRRNRARGWVINAQVFGRVQPYGPGRARCSAGRVSLSGEGVGLFTGARVADAVQCDDEGVHVAAAVGLHVLTWAAVPSGTADGELILVWRPGTINIIVSVPVPLRDAAYGNAVMTVTEAKTQALLEAGFRATGTASDAICVAAPSAGEPEDFAGPGAP